MKADSLETIDRDAFPPDFIITSPSGMAEYAPLPPMRQTLTRSDVVRTDDRASGLIGVSSPMDQLRTAIRHAARTLETVLITGETGTGKELVAREIHQCAANQHAPFVAVNCAAIPETLLEAQFFGVSKGAFTGADRDKRGFFEATGSGSLFLDEVRELPLALQAKLLRVLQEREFVPVGSVRSKPFNGRIIAATNVDLRAAVEDRTFRSDLFYRLHVVDIAVPSLRERRHDIPRLVEHFVAKYNRRNGTSFGTFGERAIQLLMRASWPGNVRELENIVTRMLVSADPDHDEDVTVPAEIVASAARVGIEARAILRSLESHRWNRHAAAADLQMSRTTLWRKMTKYNLQQ